MKPFVAIIVLSWNGKELTLACLDSLLGLAYENAKILLVDNASTDGTVEAVRKRFGGSVEIIRNAANLGFARGNNAGIEEALRRNADFILLLNNDTVVDAMLIDHLVGAMVRSPGIGIAGPKIYYFDPPDRIWFAGGEVFLWRGTAKHAGIRRRDRGQYDEERDVGYVTGCALMVRRAVVESIGMLDPSYRAYFEDTDFCMRAKRAGFGIRYVPHGKVWHKISRSTGGQIGFRKISLKLRSTIRFFGRYARPYHWLTIPFFFAADAVRIAALVLSGRIRDASGEQP
ncbi:MAG: glycosyltransferase family 2 protein [Chitinivibrionia bacterium]|nr:glycosyltransferase family 2 protein [Chitinivibrionia bacterium]